MVRDDGGQLYTIEGFAAGLIMVITAYLVVNATSVYTAGDTHINDMQLEALGSDALTIMGTPMNITEVKNGDSTLRTILQSGDMQNTFRTKFLGLVNTTGAGLKQDIQFNATYSCRKNVAGTDSIEYHTISSSRNLTGGEHTVRATKWVIVNTAVCGSVTVPRAVLVEVLLWRD